MRVPVGIDALGLGRSQDHFITWDTRKRSKVGRPDTSLHQVTQNPVPLRYSALVSRFSQMRPVSPSDGWYSKLCQNLSALVGWTL
jgi:hypothetical protein